MNAWGKHAVFDVGQCNYENARDPVILEAFVAELVKRIDMVAFGKPWIQHFGKGDPKLSGWTVMQMIETSCITIHSCDERGDAYIDVFSCKEFDVDVAEAVIREYLQPKSIRTTVLTRQA